MPKGPLHNFDYRIDCDDFLLYELGRLIEEDRASLEDEEFRRVIESGIHEHIERRLEVRVELAKRLRMSGVPPDWILRAIEDIESPLGDLLPIVQSYTAYLFERLEQCAASGPDERITSAADVLWDFPEDRLRAEHSIDTLGGIRSAVSARILAHVISEPMLAEDLELKAYAYARSMWPLPRHYILYNLKLHTHDDLPFRWFQLLIDCDEPSGVERILEEVVVHGGIAAYREDLLALTELLAQARDPETEQKIVEVLNSESTPKSVVGMLESFLTNTKAQRDKGAKADNPWTGQDRVYQANRRYVAAARLFDAGRKVDATKALDELVKDEPQYPFAVMLQGML